MIAPHDRHSWKKRQAFWGICSSVLTLQLGQVRTEVSIG